MSEVILAIDPSGNFYEGKGHTGLAWFVDSVKEVDIRTVNAKDFSSRIDYWEEIKQHIESLRSIMKEGHTVHVVMEKYVTRSNGFTTGKVSETAMLIGVLIYFCEKYNIPYTMQTPSQAKKRYSDEALCKVYPMLENKKGRIYFKGKRTNDHERDALRHLAFYKKYVEDQ